MNSLLIDRGHIGPDWGDFKPRAFFQIAGGASGYHGGLMMNPSVLDLREVPASHWRGALGAELRELAPGMAIRVLFGADPTFEVRSACLAMGPALTWHLEHDVSTGYVATIARNAALDAADVVSLLIGDHRRLDVMLAAATAALSAAEATSRQSFAKCAEALRRHLQFEDEVLAKALDWLPPDDAITLMASEHAEIRGHICVIEQVLLERAEAALDEAAILCGMLAGLMAKHEFREETLVFPRWRSALARCGARFQDALLDQARTILGR
jgi:hypothetical protein